MGFGGSSGGSYADYAAWDSQDGAGGAAYSFIEAQPQVSREQHTLQPAPPPPVSPPVPQMQQQQQQQQQQQKTQVQLSNSYNGALSSAQADADRQAMFFQMQEHLQMQQDMQRSGWMDRCWQRRRDVMKLVAMSLVVLLALSAHSVAVHYIKTYVEEATLTDWREFLFRLMYPVGVLLALWAIKGAQQRAAT